MRFLAALGLALWSFLGLVGCGDTPVKVPVTVAGADTAPRQGHAAVVEDKRVATVTVTPDTVAIERGDTTFLTCTPKNRFGTPLSTGCVWRSSDTTVAKVTTTITQNMKVRGIKAGLSLVSAWVSGKGTIRDTSKVTVTDTVTVPPEPPDTTAPPAGGVTYFLVDAEAGNCAPWVPDGNCANPTYHIVNYMGTASNSTTRPKNGSRSWKYEVTAHSGQTVDHDVRTTSNGPTTPMQAGTDGYRTGWYSFWAYVDEGYNGNAEQGAWNLLLGWMAQGGPGHNPSPISHVGLEKRGGVLQLMVRLTNAFSGCYTSPAIPGYTNLGSNGYYFQTAQSPQGIQSFPRSQWVLVSVFYQMATSNGRIQVWQDGKIVMDLTAPTLNTLGGGKGGYQGDGQPECGNAEGEMFVQFGNYGGTETGVSRLYVDDFRVSNYRPTQ